MLFKKCSCNHKENEFYANLYSRISLLEKDVEELKWYKEGIMRGTITRTTPQGTFSFRKVEDEMDKE